MSLLKSKSYYFVGIGGVGMSALARFCKMQGHSVFGYDLTPSAVTQDLEKERISVVYDSRVSALPKSVLGIDVEIIYTAAISIEHPQLAFFISQGNQIKKRAKFLAEICVGKTILAVAGTHGKTTTTALLTHIFSQTKQSFTSFMGGFFVNQKSNLIHTGNEFVIVEADEYDRSFLDLFPTIGGITSIDVDHLDVYETKEIFKETFVEFSNQISQTKIVAYGVPLPGLTYGIDVPADYIATNIQKLTKGYCFDVKTPKDNFVKVVFNELGVHNILNALCAVAIADQANIPIEASLKALSSFPGVSRRMNVFQLGEALVIDDYAHHPTEIKSVLDTIKSFYFDRKNCVFFQPHLFSRTQDFYNEFLNVLGRFDEVVLLDIYPAREEPISGIDSQAMINDVVHANKKLIKKSEIKSTMEASEATLFAFLGAGDIGVEVELLKNQLIIHEN
jgi:UDP-N-acetylmuramate--alanine ligase